jgi:beta-N-acetylhexosaminidase
MPPAPGSCTGREGDEDALEGDGPVTVGVDLAARPFFLDANAAAWVGETLATLTVEQKVGQLFCLGARRPDLGEIGRTLDVVEPGGYLLRPAAGVEIQRANRYLQERARVPMLIAANLERGGSGTAVEGTQFGTQLQVAATADEEEAHRLGLVAGREGRATGCNWTFSPVVDLDLNPDNPITGTRTFGSDPEQVARLAGAVMRGLQESGVAVTLKHWPGDGVDARDQHLVTSVNSLGVEDWEATYGRVYRALIDAGANAVMSAHIMLPAYSRLLVPGIPDEELLPASLAAELNVGLLRDRLGFNGVIVSDATSMAGFMLALPRERAVPGTIQAGCDMFLLTVSLEEDVQLMRDGLERGWLTEQRLDEAVTRVLALKASLGLHDARPLVPDETALEVVGSAEHEAWAAACADRSITLVKDRRHVLPLSVERHRRILVHVLGDERGMRDSETAGSAAGFVDRLRSRGFEVTLFEAPGDLEERWRSSERPVGEQVGRYDLVLYYANVTNRGNETVARLDWMLPMGLNAPKFVHEVPTVFISVANPYHLQHVPRVSTYINAYTASPAVLDALVDKLLGGSEFLGVSPVDPTRGLWDARL